MGTSKGIATPSGGGWSKLKRLITSTIGSNTRKKVDRIIGGVVDSAGGLGSRTGRGSGGGGSGSATVGRTVSGLAGFAADMRSNGLDAAVERLGLTDLRGRPAVEIIAIVAERLSDTSTGPQADLLASALRDAILECAALQTGGSYDDLDNALQEYFDREGIEGLIDAFLSRFVFDRIWGWIETHAQERSESSDKQALEAAVEGACHEHVRGLIADIKSEGVFDSTDWFGKQGVDLGQQIVSTLEFRLEALNDEGT